MSEEWRPIPLLPWGYEASSLGRIRSFRRDSKGKILSGHVNDRGYLSTFLQGRNYRFHHLVAATFLGQLPEGLETRHVDGDKLNNAVTNLAYGTHSENIRDQVAHGVHNQASKVECPAGHAYDDANTYRSGDGKRGCRACCRDKMRRRRDALRAQGLSSRGRQLA